MNVLYIQYLISIKSSYVSGLEVWWHHQSIVPYYQTTVILHCNVMAWYHIALTRHARSCHGKKLVSSNAGPPAY